MGQYNSQAPIVKIIGEEIFQWLTTEFDKQTSLKDVPEELLELVASVDISIRDYASSRSAIACIALITFSYKLAGKVQEPRFGGKDIVLAKVLAKAELMRRKGQKQLENKYWNYPLHELIAGQVGDRIRALPMLHIPG